VRAQRIGFDIPLASRRPCRITAKQSNVTGESFDDLGECAVIAADELLHDLRSSKTDLARVVEAVIRDRLPYVVVPSKPSRRGSDGSRSTGPKLLDGWPPKT
jgi:hypothetical protein